MAPRQERNFEEVRARVLKELAERPAPAPDALASPAPAAAVEVSTSSPVEPEHGRAGAPAELDPADRLRLLTKWPVLATPFSMGSGPATETFGQKARRPHVLVTALTGGALLVSGGVFRGLARHEQSLVRREDLSDGTMEDALLQGSSKGGSRPRR